MLTIAWDVDDVLNDFMRAWLERAWLPQHPSCKVAYEDLRSNPPVIELCTSTEEYLASLDAFREANYLAEVAPSADALAWFEKNGDRYHHIALTAVPLRCAPVSAAWTIRYFGRWIRGFHFVPSARPADPIPEYDGSKRDFLSRLGMLSVFVDDHAKNVEAAAKLGIYAILMPRPWNGSRRTTADAFRELEGVR